MATYMYIKNQATSQGAKILQLAKKGLDMDLSAIFVLTLL